MDELDTGGRRGQRQGSFLPEVADCVSQQVQTPCTETQDTLRLHLT